jgi:hypothetical protein
MKAHPLRSKHIFIENSKKMKFQPKTRFGKTMFLKFEDFDLAISKVSHYGFLRRHSSISELKDPTVGFKKKVLKNRMNSLI